MKNYLTFPIGKVYGVSLLFFYVFMSGEAIVIPTVDTPSTEATTPTGNLNDKIRTTAMRTVYNISEVLPFNQISSVLSGYANSIILTNRGMVSIKFSELEDWNIREFCDELDMSEEAVGRILKDILTIIDTWARQNGLQVKTSYQGVMSDTLSDIRFDFTLA